MSSKVESKVSIGRRMEQERARLGLSRSGLASLAKISPQAVGNYERGDNYPGAEVLLHFGAAGADLLYILTGRRESDFCVREEPPSYVQTDLNVEVLARAIAAIDARFSSSQKSPEVRAKLIAYAYGYTISAGKWDASTIEQLLNAKTGGDDDEDR